jgi:hypothetical protein
MVLKVKYEKVEDIPEPLKAEYKQVGTEWIVDVEGGLKTNDDVTRLTGALAKERTDHGNVKKLLEPFKALGDLEHVQTQLARIPELEIAAAANPVDEKKITAMVDARLSARVAPVERERDQLKSQIAEKDKTIDTFKTRERTRTIHDAVRAAGVKSKVQDTAIEDAILLSERVFDVDDQNRIFAKEGVGVTPGIEPEVWFTEMQPKRPHWWAPSGGGGAGGGGPASRGEPNPFSREHWNLTKQGEIYTKDPGTAEQLARSAGTTVGGLPAQPAKT